MVDEKKHRVSVHMTKDQFNLARRRLFVEDLSWQTVLNSLINAYIMGDISITSQGRYHISPPKSSIPVIQIEGIKDTVEIEPDWGKARHRPQAGDSKQTPRSKPKWGSKELAQHLRSVTGRRVSIQNLRKLLRTLEIEKKGNSRWVFDPDEDSETIAVIQEAIEDGVYDRLVREGTEEAQKKQQEDKAEQEAKVQDAKARRLQHLKRLRKIESP